MSDDRFDRTNGGANDMNETDKGYYEDLYNDLPKEVVDILVQTHPLMGKGGERNTEMRNGRAEDDMDSRTAGTGSRTAAGMRTGTASRTGAGAPTYRSRRPSREDVEEIREARMQQVGSEINEIRRAPQQEGDPTRYVSRRDRNREPIGEDAYIQNSQPLRADEEDYDDGIQYVSVMPARKRSKIVEEVTLQTTAAPQKRRKSRRDREPMPFEDMGRDSRDNRPRYEDIDFEERAKQEHLDNLYSSDYEDEYASRGHSKLTIFLGVAALLLIIFLIFQTVSLSSKLEEAENKLTDNEDYKTRYEQVQLEKMQVQEELEQLKNPVSADGESGGQGENGEGGSTPAGTTTSGSYTEYTVKEGETAWILAQRFLGNGAEYKKILEANNMTESDSLRIGATIRIPKKQ